MANLTHRFLAAVIVSGLAALSFGAGLRFSSAEEPTGPDLSELRDAVKAASKRGGNVEEIARALEALEKSVGKDWKAPAPGSTVAAPPELVALRNAVEAAARKGEDVEEIRTHLGRLEKALTGQELARPKPLPQPADPADPKPRPVPPPFAQALPVFPEFPAMPRVRGVDRELLQKAQELRTKALELLAKEPTDAEALKLLQEAQELMLKALAGLGGRGRLVDPLQILPEFGPGRAPERFRLGIRMERLSPITAEQLNLDGQGVAITAVIPGSVADKIGLKPNDIVIEFAGKPVSDDPEHLADRVSAVKAGDKVDLVVLRKGKRVEFKAVELPAAAEADPRQPGDIAPQPLLPELPLFPKPLNGFGGGNAFGGNANSVSVSVINGRFTIKAVQDGVKYTLTGDTAGDGDGPRVEKIVISDGDKKTIEVKSLAEVPDDYKATVERLLKSVSIRRR